MCAAARGASSSTDYQLRIIGPDAIGHDVNIPPLPISYRIHSRVGAAATLEGRDLSYVMPMMPIKVLSLVPADAGDIRDASEASLGAVDSLRFRSSLFRVLTLTFGALAAVMAVLALVPLARPVDARCASERERIPDRASLGSAAAQSGRGAGACARRGLDRRRRSAARSASMRLVAAAAIDQPISQKPLANGGSRARRPAARPARHHAQDLRRGVEPGDGRRCGARRVREATDFVNDDDSSSSKGLQSGLSALTDGVVSQGTGARFVRAR